MITKTVKRYWCDHCHKAGCGKWQMERHEKHCTNNPNRECRMCGVKSRDYSLLSSGLAIRTNAIVNSSGEDMRSANTDALDWLRDEVEGCPACMLAVLRQCKVWSSEWNYKKEHELWWSERNSERMENVGYP